MLIDPSGIESVIFTAYADECEQNAALADAIQRAIEDGMCIEDMSIEDLEEYM